MADEPTPEEAVREIQKRLDDELVARYQHFSELALRMITGDGRAGVYDPLEVRHLTEMLLLLDIAHSGFTRFRSRYA